MDGNRTVDVRYFALFREQAGCAGESVVTRCVSAADLYADLASRHGFTLAAGLVRVAINRGFRPMETPLADGDEVVFVPPVAGG